MCQRQSAAGGRTDHGARQGRFPREGVEQSEDGWLIRGCSGVVVAAGAGTAGWSAG